jgi:hypothetical protein
MRLLLRNIGDTAARIRRRLGQRVDPRARRLHLRVQPVHATPRQGVDVTTYAAWVSLLQSIKRRNGVAIIYYDGTGTCAALPTYDLSPAPVYVGDTTP